MTEFPPTHVPDAAARRRQRAKNLAIGALVAALSLLFYLITIVRMGRLWPAIVAHGILDFVGLTWD